MNNATKFHAVIPAAGAGARMAAGMPKQYLPLAGSTVLEHSLHALLACESIDRVVLVLAPDDDFWPTLREHHQDGRVETVVGGAERCHSVMNGIQHLAETAESDDWVLVHDAARPCLHKKDIAALIAALENDPVGGLLGIPVADTLKQVDADALVTQTIERAAVWHALTPQMFRLGLLQDALQTAISRDVLVTDEAAAMELAGHRPRMIEGRHDNIKITRPGDLELADFYLQSRRAL